MGFDLQESTEPWPEPPGSSWDSQALAPPGESLLRHLSLHFISVSLCIGYKGLLVTYMLAILLRALLEGASYCGEGWGVTTGGKQLET